MTVHISCKVWHKSDYKFQDGGQNGTEIIILQNSIEFEASAYVLHDIRQVAALVDLSRKKTSDKRWQHLILPLFGGWLHMCICVYIVVRVWLMFVHMCVIKVMFEVYGVESESMSDQYRIFLFLAIY